MRCAKPQRDGRQQDCRTRACDTIGAVRRDDICAATTEVSSSARVADRKVGGVGLVAESDEMCRQQIPAFWRLGIAMQQDSVGHSDRSARSGFAAVHETADERDSALDTRCTMVKAE